MAKLTVPEGVDSNTVPKELLELDDDFRYKLTKIGSKREPHLFGVWEGDSVRGDIVLVNVHKTVNLAGLRIQGHGMNDYIRTSPIVKITDISENTVTFETEGGFYKLERLADN